MKRPILLSLTIIVFAFPLLSFAQPYDWNLAERNYEPLTEGIMLTGTTPWDSGTVHLIPLDYEIPFFNESITSIYVHVGRAELHFSPESDQGLIRVVGDYFASTELLVDKGQDQSESPVLYQIDGAPGERIVKIEYRNMGFFFDESAEDYINFQIWLHEDGRIEAIWGAHSVNAPLAYGWNEHNGPAFNILSAVIGDDDIILTGPGDDPNVMFTWNQWGHLYHLESTPPKNIVYQFYWNDIPNSSHFQTKTTPELSPNPANGSIWFSGINDQDLLRIDIVDLSGKTVRTIEKKHITGNQINLDELKSGLYIIRFNIKNGVFSSKIIKI